MLSQRALRRQRRRTAEIVAEALRDLRPQAPLQQVRRLVAERCAAAGLPEPSSNALAAKIADIRRFDPDQTMLVLDRCFVETDAEGTGPEIATLHVAILHPPGRIMAYRAIGGPPEPAIDADLLIELQSASGPSTPARVRLAASGPTEVRIREALLEARLTPVSRTTRWSGEDAKEALGRSLLPDKVRMRVPRLEAGVPWACPQTIRQLSSRLNEALGPERPEGAHAAPQFALAAPHRASTFIAALRDILRSR